MPNHKGQVRKRRALPSRAIRRAARQFAEMPAWLRVACAAACAALVVLGSVSAAWGALEWLRVVGTAACATGLAVSLLLLLRGTDA